MKFSPEKIATIYCEHLLEQKKLENLRMISRFWNSFEGWAKWELAIALSNTKTPPLYPWTTGKSDAKQNRIGVESLVSLDMRMRVTRECAKSKKQIDLWVEDDEEADAQWHAVELKVVFNNNNQDKQFWSWAQDFDFIRSIRATDCGSATAIAFAVGFESEALSSDAYWIQLIAPCKEHDTNPAWYPSVHLGILGCKVAPSHSWFAGKTSNAE